MKNSIFIFILMMALSAFSQALTPADPAWIAQQYVASGGVVTPRVFYVSTNGVSYTTNLYTSPQTTNTYWRADVPDLDISSANTFLISSNGTTIGSVAITNATTHQDWGLADLSVPTMAPRSYDIVLYNSVGLTNVATVTNGLQVVAGGGGDGTAKWYLNDGTGTTATDNSGNGHNGTLVNSPVWANADAGHTAGYLVFTASSSQHVTCGMSTNEQPTTAGTITAWIKPASLSSQVIYSYGNFNTDRNGAILFIGGDGNLRCELCNASTAYINSSSSSTVSVGTWYFVAVTWDGSTVNVYLNGANVHSEASGITPTAGTYNAQIGIDGALSADSYFDGSIDDVEVFPTALSSGTISTMYGAGAH